MEEEGDITSRIRGKSKAKDKFLETDTNWVKILEKLK